MEFYWNAEWRSMISRILDYHQDKDMPVFVLVSGVSGLGKITFLRQVLSQFLWDFERQDLLWIRDCSLELDKNHVLPIEMPSTQKTIALKSGEVYENRGVREITTWLQQSSFWGKKCLLIENIERMSLGAMNAFLKTCEEPLKNRFIFCDGLWWISTFVYDLFKSISCEIFSTFWSRDERFFESVFSWCLTWKGDHLIVWMKTVIGIWFDSKIRAEFRIKELYFFFGFVCEWRFLLLSEIGDFEEGSGFLTFRSGD